MIESKGTKKISLNLDQNSLKKIDELAEIFKITRTLIIESIITAGLKEYLKIIEGANKKIREQTKNPKLDEMLEKLKKFKEKWDLV